MKFELKDKIALVTGASSGIGCEVSRALAEKGAKVEMVGRNVQSLTKIKQQINDKGKVAELFPYDLTKLDEIPDLVEKIRSRFGGTVDLLVNNAGISVLGMVENVPRDVYENIFKTNFFGPLAINTGSGARYEGER